MKSQHIKKYLLEWLDDKLSPDQMKMIKDHLVHCRECREYYAKMEVFLTKPDSPGLPRLQPDYFLPTKIKELAKKNGRNRALRASKKIKYQITFGTIIVFFALISGIFMGKWISQTPAVSETEVVLSYGSMLSDDGINQVWDNIGTQTNGQQTQGGEEL